MIATVEERLQVDPEVQPSIETPDLPPEAALLCVMARRLGTDAVEALAFDVKLPCRRGDLVVEEVKAAEGFGVGELEVPVRAPAALDLLELALGLGKLSVDPVPLGSCERLESVPQRAFALGGPGRLLAEAVALPQAGMLGLGQRTSPLPQGVAQAMAASPTGVPFHSPQPSALSRSRSRRCMPSTALRAR